MAAERSTILVFRQSLPLAMLIQVYTDINNHFVTYDTAKIKFSLLTGLYSYENHIQYSSLICLKNGFTTIMTL